MVGDLHLRDLSAHGAGVVHTMRICRNVSTVDAARLAPGCPDASPVVDVVLALLARVGQWRGARCSVADGDGVPQARGAASQLTHAVSG